MIYGVLILAAAVLLAFHIYLALSRHVPVLMYHRIADLPGDRNAMPPERFAEQLDYLASKGFVTLSCSRLFDLMEQRRPLPRRAVVLTFDDAYADVFIHAFPELRKRGMTATVFPIADWIGKENRWEKSGKAPAVTMTLEQLRSWRDAGMEIGSHTLSHRALTKLPPDEAALEIFESRARLAELLEAPIDFLCYPYGACNAEIMKMAEEAGYRGALAINESIPAFRVRRYAFPRLASSSKQSMLEFKLKVSVLHPLLIAARVIESRVRRTRRRLLGR